MQELIKKQSKAELPEYLKMYEISGQDPITERGVERYQRDKKQDELIKQQVEKQDDIFLNPLVQKIQKASADELPDLLEWGLQSRNSEIQKLAATEIQKVPPHIMASLIKIGLNQTSPRVQRECALRILDASEKDRMPLVKLAFEKQDIKVHQIAASAVTSFRGQSSEKDRLKNIVLQKAKEYLNSDSKEVRKEAFEFALWIPEEEKGLLVEQGLNDDALEVRLEAISRIGLLPQKTLAFVLEQLLEHPNPEIRKAAGKKIVFAGMDKRVDLMNKCIESSDNVLQVLAAERTGYLRMEERGLLQKKILEKIKRCIESSDKDVQKHARDLMVGAPYEERENLFNYFVEKGFGEDLVRSPLYDNKNMDDESFWRSNFEKSGSETTLFGGELKGKTIVRHIKPEAFLAWQKVYEDYALWQKNDFDYVPIEPIQSYQFNTKTGLVDVFSGVLDLSLDRWAKKSERFKEELKTQYAKINSVMDKANVKHGDIGNHNFCLRFFRDDQGKIDFNKVPRLYLIDLDRAVSPEK